MKKVLFAFQIALIAIFIMSCGQDNDYTDSAPDIYTPVKSIKTSEIKCVSARLYGWVDNEIIREDRLGVVKYGFIISENDDPNVANGWTMRCDNIKDGEYDILATNLVPNKEYYFCSYLYDGTSYHYGEVLNFRTKTFKIDYLSCEAEPRILSNYTHDVLFKANISEELGILNDFTIQISINDNVTLVHEGLKMNNSGIYENIWNDVSEGCTYKYIFSLIYVDDYGKAITLSGGERGFSIETSLKSEEIDLGLSVIWMGRNIEANSLEDLGTLYAWGETSPKDLYEKTNYTLWDIVSDINIISGTIYDVARKELGEEWAIPTYDEARELIDNCTWVWTSVNGKDGAKGISKINGEEIFFPSAGGREIFLWLGDKRNSSSAYTLGWLLYLNGSLSPTTSFLKSVYNGLPIRAVKR